MAPISNRKAAAALVALIVFATTIVVYASRSSTTASYESDPAQSASVFGSLTENATTSISTSTPATLESTSTAAKQAATSSAPIVKKGLNQAPKSEITSPPNQIQRVQNPYDSPSLPFSDINQTARAALVNILCQPQSGTLRPISGSGIIIDPRGVILTNAHVAQYVLLSESLDIDLNCYIRSGAPAAAHWRAIVLYMPAVWVEKHASEINTQQAQGTGEHDYALLLINGSTDGEPLPPSFPYLPPDAREAIAFETDPVLVATYPAEFIGGLSAQNNLYPASSITTIKQLLTFETSSVDLLSVGGVIEAQSGSSGGAIVNAWGKLVGIIVTTSLGPTTAERDLRGLSVNYINRDIEDQSGIDLIGVLSRNVFAEAAEFTKTAVPALLEKYFQELLSRGQ